MSAMADYHDPLDAAIVPADDVTPEEHDDFNYDDDAPHDDDHNPRHDDDHHLNDPHRDNIVAHDEVVEGPRDVAPVAPPPLVEEDPPVVEEGRSPVQCVPLHYNDQKTPPFYRHNEAPTYLHNDDDEPTYPNNIVGGPTTPPTTPITEPLPNLPLAPPRPRSRNAAPHETNYHHEPVLPTRSNSTLPRDHSNTPRNTSTLPRDTSTLPRDHCPLPRDQFGDMDRISAKNTILSYKTDRTARTIMDPETRAKARKVYRSALTHLVCGLYALILVVIGLVFSLSTALTHPIEERTLYLQVFLLYVYGVSLIFLLYLHCCLLSRRKSRADGSSSHRVNLVSNNQLDHDKCSVDYNHDLDMTINMSKDKRSRSRSRSRSHSDFEDAIDGASSAFEAVTFDAEDINFYLRLGAIGFGIGSMIHDGFRIASLFIDGEFTLDCRGPMYVAVAVSHMAFTFFQTFYIFKNHKIVINKHKAFVRFGFMHMVAANLVVWCVTTISETAESITKSRSDDASLEDIEIINGSGDYPNSSSGLWAALDCSEMHNNSLAVMAAPFLFPCTIEYSLIAAAVLYRMYSNVGRVGRHSINEIDDGGIMRMGCHKANKGLFFGLFVVVMTLIAVSCFFVFTGQAYGYEVGELLFFCIELLLLFLCFSAVIVGFARMQKLRFMHEVAEGQLDMVLLVISFFGICVFNIFLCISSVSRVVPFDLMPTLAICTAGLGLIQAALQTVFIMDGLRRCAASQHDVDTKPGRALVTFLLLCNLSLWVVNTFEVEKADAVPMHQEYFGELAWEIITHLCVPLMIFFRFHSTVCLSDIWINAYKIKKKEL